MIVSVKMSSEKMVETEKKLGEGNNGVLEKATDYEIILLASRNMALVFQPFNHAYLMDPIKKYTFR